jgi:2-polyprenyl-3-methyl-5-hydroxy-6-metoxy-1,4-benzoquinol methylase
MTSCSSGAESTLVQILSEAAPDCLLCGRPGCHLYHGLTDHLFGAPGTWQMVECRACGIAWLHPRPLRSEIAKAYQRYHTHTVSGEGEVFRAAVSTSGWLNRMRIRMSLFIGAVMDHIRATTLGYPTPAHERPGLLAALLSRIPSVRDSALLAVAGLPAVDSGKLLDVGCGSGQFMSTMRGLGWDVFGVESDPAAAAIARDEHGLTVFVGELKDAQLDPSVFHAITLSHVIEHVYDPIDLLRECRRVLRPDGLIVLTTPNLESVGHRWFRSNWRGLEPPRHLNLFGPSALKSLVVSAGFTVKNLGTSARLVRGIWWYSRMQQMKSGSRPRSPGLATYFESYLMTLVEDIWRLLAPFSSEETILCASKTSD